MYSPEEKLQLFVKSNVWDYRYGLPSVPQHSNPLIYTCYSLKIIGELNRIDKNIMVESAKAYLSHQKMGDLSHDEKMIAWLDPKIAKSILQWEDEHGSSDERFIFYYPFMKACCVYDLGILSQVLWSIHLIVSAFTYKLGQESGALKIWIMIDKMERFVITPFAIIFWRWMMNRKGATLKKSFQVYFPNHPIFAELCGDF